MAGFGKWIGGVLGWTFGGPIGGIIGFAAGSFFDGVNKLGNNATQSGYTNTRRNDFGVSLLVLSAAVMKADGKALRTELDFVKRFFTEQFGAAATQEYMMLFKDILKQNIPVQEVCLQIRHNMDYHARLMLLQYLFGLSHADGLVSSVELNLIKSMATYMGIRPGEYESIKAMFVRSQSTYEDPYSILEIPRTATGEEIKKAYRKMAMKYHPDRVIDLGEQHQKAAKEKFQKVQNAYEKLKKERVFA